MGYQLQGYDFNPEGPKTKDTLSELVKLLQKNRLKLEVKHWHRAYNSLHQEYLAFKLERNHTSRRYYYYVYQLLSR